ncbi:hypothetical protein [Rhodopirellula bahusiensis]|uniref:hypothetical protein n=1 Tax=Rhodopirellula bahusiensis TaxID=2014065 RepID=UPI003262E38F
MQHKQLWEIAKKRGICDDLHWELDQTSWPDFISETCDMMHGGWPQQDCYPQDIEFNLSESDLRIRFKMEWVEQQFAGCHDAPVLHPRSSDIAIQISGEGDDFDVTCVDNHPDDPEQGYYVGDFI